MIVKGTLKKALRDRGIDPLNFKPLDNVLTWLQMSRKRFYKIIRDETDVSLAEAIRISHWLSIPLGDMYVIQFEAKDDTLIANNGQNEKVS